MISFRAACSCAALLASVAMPAVAGVPASASYTTIDGFRQFARADLHLEQLDGPGNIVLSSPYPGIYPFTVHATSPTPGVLATALGTGAAFNDQGTVIDFTGQPVGRAVTAFAGTVRVTSVGGTTSIGGTVTVQTDTGISFTLTVPVAGQFFGITSATPFTTVTVGGAGFELVRDVYVGSAVAAPIAGESCGDAPTVGIGQFPFTTVNLIGTNTSIPGTCALGGLDTGNDVWFHFVPPTTGLVTMSTCGCTFDSVLRVFNGCPVGAVNPTQIACNDDFCASGTGNTASQVSFRASGGVGVYVRISGYNGASGAGNLTVSQVPDCRGDFNHTGATEVQDIFDFLAAWFAGC